MVREVSILSVILSLPKTCIYQRKHKHMLLKDKIVINMGKDIKNFNTNLNTSRPFLLYFTSQPVAPYMTK